MSTDTPRPERVTLTDEEREALLSPESLRDEVAAALAGQAVRVQVVSVGTAVGFLRAESALHLADALLASPALADLIREARGQALREEIGVIAADALTIAAALVRSQGEERTHVVDGQKRHLSTIAKGIHQRLARIARGETR